MDILEIAVGWVRREPGMALATAVGLYLLLFLLVFWALARQVRLARRQTHLLTSVEGANLEDALLEKATEGVSARIEDAAALGRANADSLRQCLQKVGVVRYDAFADVGGGQSFSVALLDGDNNGIVFSGLYSRSDVRVYAKPIVAGASSVALTKEEQDALARSRAGGPELPEPRMPAGGRGGARR